MKVLVSSAYSQWRKANKNQRAALAVDRFLLRMQNAESSNCAPKPKRHAGNDAVKDLGTILEFVIVYNYRIYANYIKLDGEEYFCVSMFGNKADKDQAGDIINAIKLFYCSQPEKWTPWEPSPEMQKQIEAAETTDVTVAEEVEEATEAAAAQSTKKKKGKPLDENGLTVAQRKALRKQQQQQEVQKMQNAKKQKAQQTNTESVAAATAPVASVAPVVAPVAPAAPVSDDIGDDEVRVLGTGTALNGKPVAPVVTPTAHTAPASDDIGDDEIRILGTETTLNGKPVAQPQPIAAPVEFSDYANVQYELELLEHQVIIEKLKLKAIQSEIAIEQLQIKKLKLLQLKKVNEK